MAIDLTFKRINELDTATTLDADNDVMAIAQFDSGTYVSRKVTLNQMAAELKGSASLSGLSDVSIGGIVDGQTIKYSNGTWVAGTLSDDVVGAHTLEDTTVHTNMTVGTPVNGNILKYNGSTSKWEYYSPTASSTKRYSGVVTMTVGAHSVDYTKAGYIHVATASTSATLPTSANTTAGDVFVFAKNNSYSGNLQITAPAGVKIADSSTAGYIKNTTTAETFANITLVAINSTNWIVLDGHGTWVTG